ncbi:hypothetical protein ARMSODRAFT_1004246 [Armillaria solidipes]|uniref:Uncharacterized protein n=1 Tax=Armillaria solidipes TaxID=1076256 RepID=A0A2H3BIL9_9AGAR|nr:hypothetical protein ARMSODRAFT_1004246 [Armillaria solidipes]
MRGDALIEEEKGELLRKARREYAVSWLPLTLMLRSFGATRSGTAFPDAETEEPLRMRHHSPDSRACRSPRNECQEFSMGQSSVYSLVSVFIWERRPIGARSRAPDG